MSTNRLHFIGHRFGSNAVQEMRWRIAVNMAQGNGKGHGNKAAKREAMLELAHYHDERLFAYLDSEDFDRDMDRMAELDEQTGTRRYTPQEDEDAARDLHFQHE